MTRTLLFSATGAMLSIGIATGAYAAQGPTDARPASEQSSLATGSMEAKLGSSARSAPSQSISQGTVGRTQSIEGEVLRIEGNIYVVKNTAAKELRLHVNKHTNIDDNITPKDLITARVSRMSTTLGNGHRSIDPNHSTSGDRSQGAITWHADSIKKR